MLYVSYKLKYGYKCMKQSHTNLDSQGYGLQEAAHRPFYNTN